MAGTLIDFVMQDTLFLADMQAGPESMEAIEPVPVVAEIEQPPTGSWWSRLLACVPFAK